VPATAGSGCLWYSPAHHDVVRSASLYRVALDDVAQHIIDRGHDVFVQPRLGRFGVLAYLIRPGSADYGRRDMAVMKHSGEGRLSE
jgi:hypothetical protein